MYKGFLLNFSTKEGLKEMKPENWDSLTPQNKKDVAQELLYSHRGKYIVYRAITLAIETLQKVPESLRESLEFFPKPDFASFGLEETREGPD